MLQPGEVVSFVSLLSIVRVAYLHSVANIRCLDDVFNDHSCPGIHHRFVSGRLCVRKCDVPKVFSLRLQLLVGNISCNDCVHNKLQIEGECGNAVWIDRSSWRTGIGEILQRLCRCNLEGLCSHLP